MNARIGYWICGLMVVLAMCLSARAEDWLVSRDGLVFGYAPGTGGAVEERVIAFGSDGEATEAGKDQSFVANRGRGLIPRGLARYDRYFGLATVNGSFVATGGVNHIVTACRKSGAFSLMVRLTPPLEEPGDRDTIFWLGPRTGDPNLSLFQEGSRVSMRLRTAKDGRAGESVIELFEWADAAPRHLVVTYADSTLRVYLDGEATPLADAELGDLSRWRASELVFGDDYQASGSWSGKQEAFALFDRALSADEVKQQHARIAQLVAGRKKPVRIRIAGTLTARSAIPDPVKIAPYYQALSVFEYSVDKVLEGEFEGDRIAVAHWVIMDRKTLPIAKNAIGDKAELVLERYAENPQLETDYWLMSDLEDPGVELWYDVTGVP